MSKYEAVIGIETHVQLSTKTKLFCGCDNDSRTAEPNTNICPVCFALPGALPVLNKHAVELAIRAGLALNADIKKNSFFERKNYFYPDSPSGYQITQLSRPIVGRGFVEMPVDGTTVKVRINRAQLEADAGKLTHPTGADYSLVDLNRAGTPLLEIVSEPDMRSPEEAKAYAIELYNLMRYAKVSDADLYHGNMRFDVNTSLRLVGSKELGTRTEVKNLNSFRAVYNAVASETRRQTGLLEKGEEITQETRGYSDATGETFSQRSKEEAHDYRYFPEPDVPPIVVTAEMINQAKKMMPRFMPGDIRHKLGELGVNARQVEALFGQSWSSSIVEDLIDDNNEQKAKDTVNMLTGPSQAIISSKNLSDSDIKATYVHYTTVSGMLSDGLLSSTNARRLVEMFTAETVKDVDQFARRHNMIQNSNESEIEAFVDQAIADNPKILASIKAGNGKAAGALVGAVMKLSKGQANPGLVNKLLKKKLG